MYKPVDASTVKLSWQPAALPVVGGSPPAIMYELLYTQNKTLALPLWTKNLVAADENSATVFNELYNSYYKSPIFYTSYFCDIKLLNTFPSTKKFSYVGNCTPYFIALRKSIRRRLFVRKIIECDVLNAKPPCELKFVTIRITVVTI